MISARQTSTEKFASGQPIALSKTNALPLTAHYPSLTIRFTPLAAFLLLALTTSVAAQPDVTIIDAHHYSNVLGETRNYRIFLPPGYSGSETKRYPVIYFFHGWSQRYFGSSSPYGDFDKGDDNGGDNIANFVKGHDVIVVKADGYNRSPDEPYYVRPYNVTPVETYRQFPIYFPELVEHIDFRYRTLADRGHRGIAGLSMGGFMTYWIGGKYPHLLSAAGNFCGSAEFTVGPRDFPVEYRHLDMHKNYGGMNVRLHYGNRDFIRGYHEDLNRVWPQLMDNYSYKVFDAAHSTCGMGEMLGFILETFSDPPSKPEQWHHTDVYPAFSVWDYKVTTDRAMPGFTTLENVNARGFRCSVREFLPDGEYLPSVGVAVRTAPVYDKNRLYVINDIDLRTMKSSQHTIRSGDDGTLTLRFDGGPHEIGINKQADAPNLVVTAYALKKQRWATAGDNAVISIQVANKGLATARNTSVNAVATRPTASVEERDSLIPEILVNGTATVEFNLRATVDTIEVAKFKITLRDEKKHEWVDHIEVPFRRKQKTLEAFVIADGKTLTVAQSGNDTAAVFLGAGNGDGIANPGESIVVLARDQGKLWRTDLTGNDPCVNPFGLSIRESDSWTSFDHVGASAKYDVPLIASDCQQNHPLEFFVEYWLPEYPLHLVRQGVVKIRVKGTDTTPPQVGRVQVTGDNVLQVKLYDGARIRSAKATLINEKDPKKTVSVILTDDATNGDRAEGDFVFSRTIPTQVFGIFKAVIESEDAFGNRAIHEGEDVFVLH